MLGGGPFAHVISAFRHQTQNRVRTKSMDLRQVASQQSIKCSTHVEAQLITTLCMARLRQRLLRGVAAFVERPQDGFDFSITLSDLGLMEIVQLQRLAQSENVLKTIITSECSDDGLW